MGGESRFFLDFASWMRKLGLGFDDTVFCFYTASDVEAVLLLGFYQHKFLLHFGPIVGHHTAYRFPSFALSHYDPDSLISHDQLANRTKIIRYTLTNRKVLSERTFILRDSDTHEIKASSLNHFSTLIRRYDGQITDREKSAGLLW